MTRGSAFQIGAAVGTVGLAFVLGPIRRMEPFYTYFYLWAWAPLLCILVAFLRRRSPGHLLLERREFLSLFPFSVTLWLVFEALNFRVGNWSYQGLPAERFVRWTGYILAFSSVAPAVLLLSAFLERKPEAANVSSLKARRGRATAIATGLLMLLLPMAWPVYFFPLIWGFAFFLADPWVERWGGHSLMADWRNRHFSRTHALLLSGFICGGYWEMCNYWAGAKWVYHIPFVGHWKIFEMPILGFLGFPAFALEVHALHELIRAGRSRWLKRKSMILAITLVTVLFWMVTFAGIDAWTVRSTKERRQVGSILLQLSHVDR